MRKNYTNQRDQEAGVIKYVIMSNNDLQLHFDNREYYNDRRAVDRFQNLSGLFGDLRLYKKEDGVFYLYNQDRSTFLEVQLRKNRWQN